MCGVKRFMLNKNLFKRLSLFTFVMLFCSTLVSSACLASNQKAKTPNGYAPVNDFCSSSDEEEDLDALFEGVEPVQKETNNQGSNLAESNNQIGNSNEEESDDESWHEEEKSESWEEEDVNREEESSEDETPELEVNDGDYDADDENYYYPGKER